MTLFQTLRFKLTIIYLLTIVTPFVILAFALPYYAEGILTKNTEKLTKGTLNALVRNIKTYLDDLERLTTSPYLNDNVIEALKIKASGSYETANAYIKLQTDRALTGTLPNYLINTREDILSTIIISSNGQSYLTTKNDPLVLIPQFPFSSQDWYKKAIASDGRAAFISSHPQDYMVNQRIPRVFSVARLIKDPDSRQPLAVILADADTNVLEKITTDISFNVSSIVAILDENRQVIYSNKPLPEAVQTQLSQDDTFTRSSKNNASFVTVSENIEPVNWQIVVFLSNAELKSMVRWIYIVAVLFSIGGLFVTFFIFFYFSRGIVNPFKQMNNVMNHVKNGNLEARFVPKGKDEIAVLGEALNNMIYRLDELINREYKAVLAQRNAEYRALQSQIQPHFLYNTLNGFIGLNRAGDTRQLETAIISLSGMLRYILQENQWSTIGDEFEFLRKYGLLQQIRFEERLEIIVEYEDTVGAFRIPKLLVQPLLENAIIHGVEPNDKQNRIKVSAARKQVDVSSCVCIEIIDDGTGFDMSSELEQSRSHTGLSNVEARLQLAYPEAVMSVRSVRGSGTQVTILIPKGEAGHERLIG